MDLKTAAKALKFVARTVLTHKLRDIPVPCLVGDSGIGKTTIIRQVFQDLIQEKLFDAERAVFIYKILSECEIGDIYGLPDLNRETKRTEYLAPPWWPADNSQPFIFFDEFGDTKNDVQRAVQQLLLEKTICERALPEHSFICLAMNPINPEFGSFDFSRQLRNRLMFWRVTPKAEDWLEFATKQKNIIQGITQVIAADPTMLHEPVEFEVDTGFRNPRSVTAAATLAFYITPEETKEFGYSLFSSIVGPIMAGTLVQLIEGNIDKDALPINPKEVLDGKSNEYMKRVELWTDSGKFEMIYESLLLMREELRQRCRQKIPDDAANRLIALLLKVPSDMLVDFFSALSKNGMSNLLFVLGTKSKELGSKIRAAHQLS